MKRKTWICLSLLLCLMGQAFAQVKAFDISGTVVDSVTQKPLMGVYVTVGKQGVRTNNSGSFLIKKVTQGDVNINTSFYSSYTTINRDIHLTSDTTIYLILAEKGIAFDDVVVTGTRTEKRLSQTPILTTVIQESEIQKAGAVSMLESLQDNIPGIVVSPNAMGNNMRIKGLNSRYILFLVDGERLVSEGAGGNVNLDQIDVDNIKKVEMISGASSALYGSNAVGAVINIITKAPIHEFEGGANLIAESNNTWKAKIDAGTNLKKCTSRISLFRNSSDGFGADGNGAYAARYVDYGGHLKLGYKPTERIDINMVGRYFRHETFNPQNSINVSHALTHNMSLGLSGGYLTADKRNNLRVSLNFDKFFNYDILEKKGNEHSKNNTASYVSSRVLNTFTPTEKWEVVGGVEYNHEENYAINTLGTTATTKKLDDLNLFAQAEYEILKDFDVVAGARYTYNTQFKSAFTPKLSLMYSIDGFKFRASVGTAFRAPSIKELYYDFDHQGMFWIYGNPDLKSEKGLYSSLSTEYTIKNFNISVSGYYNKIDNKITQYDVINELGGNEKYYKNVSSATLQGVDVSLYYILFRELVFKGNYSFCDAKDHSTGLQLSSNVKHSGTVSLTWNGKIAHSPFSLQFAGRLNSPIYYQELMGDLPSPDVVPLAKSKSYAIWKAVLVKPFHIAKHTVELTLKVDNIFDFKDVSFIDSGRQYLIGIKYAFN
ncbi:MAG: TonB-dependent receptor [Rikenellaceae bacterium]